MDSFFLEFTDLLDRPEVSVTSGGRETSSLSTTWLWRIKHPRAPTRWPRVCASCAATDPLDPSPQLQFPLILDTATPCPFKEDEAVWVEGYVGFRWGDWQKRSRPH